jgi:gamma-glutamylcyclotransferase (GGCT)/AIG2-like uncharacterized protein YtfP
MFRVFSLRKKIVIGDVYKRVPGNFFFNVSKTPQKYPAQSKKKKPEILANVLQLNFHKKTPRLELLEGYEKLNQVRVMLTVIHT